MKKLVISLMVLVLAVGAVCASPTSMVLNYSVAEVIERSFTFSNADGSETGNTFSVGGNNATTLEDPIGIIGGSVTFKVVDTTYANIPSGATAKLYTISVGTASGDNKFKIGTGNDNVSDSIVTVGAFTRNEAASVNKTAGNVQCSTAVSGSSVTATYTLGLMDRRVTDATNNWIASFPVTWTTDTTVNAGAYHIDLVVTVSTT